MPNAETHTWQPRYTLDHDIRATLIHGTTGLEVEDATLEAGTTYDIVGLPHLGLFGEHIATIVIPDGTAWYVYRTRDPDVCRTAEATTRGV